MADRGVEVIFTPKYSPDFNPVEFAFNKLKTMAKQEYYRNLLTANLQYAIYELLDTVTPNDAVGFLNTGKLVTWLYD